MSKINLFVNGDSHTAEVYPNPGNLNNQTASQILAKRFDLDLENIAMPGGSNQRIVRTTLERLRHLDPNKTIIMIGWSSFERTEWFYQDRWHQICGESGYSIDEKLRDISGLHIQAWYADQRKENFRIMQEQHNMIWRFHDLLHNLGYKFLFYQGCPTAFFDGCPEQDQPFKHHWHPGTWAHNPYICPVGDQRVFESFVHYCLKHGLQHADARGHFGQDAHDAWANYLTPYLQQLIDQKNAK